MFSAFSIRAKPELGLRLSFTKEDDHHLQNPSRFLFYAWRLCLWVERAHWNGEPKASLRAKRRPCILPASNLSSEPEERQTFGEAASGSFDVGCWMFRRAAREGERPREPKLSQFLTDIWARGDARPPWRGWPARQRRGPGDTPVCLPCGSDQHGRHPGAPP